MRKERKTPWYAAGLHFECVQCGACCAGPGEGYIWVTKPEIQLIADFLKETTEQIRRNYLKRVGLRTTIIEQTDNKDCVFLREIDGQKSWGASFFDFACFVCNNHKTANYELKSM